MDPVERMDHNFTYKGEYEDEAGKIANPGVGDLSCRVVENYTFAHFKPTEEELALLNDGGVVELHIVGHPIPPLGMEVVTRQPEPPQDEGSQNGEVA